MPIFSVILRVSRWGLSLLLLVLGCVLFWQVTQRLDWNIYDAYSRWSVKQGFQKHEGQGLSSANTSNIRLVLLDDQSIEKLKDRYGMPPWRRETYVEIFSQLQDYQPAVTVFDGHFMFFQQDNDEKTFDALRHIPHLVLGVVHQQESLLHQELKQRQQTKAGNYYLLNLGVVNMEPDTEDGVLRSLRPIWPPTQMTPGVFPTLSLSAALEYLRNQDVAAGWVLDWQNVPEPKLIFYSEQQPARNHYFQLLSDATLLLRWQKLLDANQKERMDLPSITGDISHQALPLWKLLIPDSPKMKRQVVEELQGKIIVIGSASSIYPDLHRTPISTHQLGADIQATAIDNFLSIQPIQPLSAMLLIPITVLLFVIGVLLRIFVRKSEHSFLYTLGTMVIYAWFAYWLFYRFQLWIPVVAPECSVLIGHLLATVWLVLMQDKEVTLLEGHLSRLVSQSVFQEIRQMSRIITQGGRKLDITTMMVDIRNFTGMAESLPPQQVTALLNEFYELVVNIMFQHRGTVDKFLGDGVMILFGAPVPNTTHAQDAVQAALALAEASQALVERWKLERGIETKIGTSIHSGSAFVGFIGPKNKLEYTAIGDTVNICARLQEQSKLYETPIIVTQDTLIQCPHFQQYFSPIGPVKVRGRDTEIEVWAVKVLH